MSNTDSSAYTLRFNEVTQGLEFAANGTWYPVPTAAGGITQLTGDVTAGPGSGSQVATLNIHFVSNEIPSGAIDSSNVTFTLAHTPIVGSVSLFRNGILQNPNASVDYSITGATITMTTAPVTLDTLLANYRF
jgi:hypothetical protein